MAVAYLKVWVGIGKERSVRDALAGVEGVRRSDLTTGGQDIMALLEADDYQALLDLILGTVRGIDGIERTETNLVLD